jgi:branched-chain amino acid transport system permease protein
MSASNSGTAARPVMRDRRTLRLAAWAALLAIACALPFVLSGYHTFQLTLMLVYSIALLGLNILTGYSGQISLGHGAFYALGAYSTVILINSLGIPYWATLPISAATCFVVGFLFGVPALRLEGLYLALATFALGLTMPALLKYKHFSALTGGSQGLAIVKPDPPFGLPIDPDQWLYFFILIIAIVLFVLARNLLHGRVGRALVAIRDHLMAAEAMGINSALFKSLTFGVSAMYTGIAGGLGAIAVQVVAPDSFNFFLSISFLVGSVIGGISSIVGAVFGGAFIVLVPNIANQISAAASWAIYGVFLIGFMYLLPDGVAGFLRAAVASARRRMRRNN